MLSTHNGMDIDNFNRKKRSCSMVLVKEEFPERMLTMKNSDK
jgi:hypothetical protein